VPLVRSVFTVYGAWIGGYGNDLGHRAAAPAVAKYVQVRPG